jgi:hypothetical protein
MPQNQNGLNPDNAEQRAGQEAPEMRNNLGAPNPVYQELMLQYLATGKHDTFATSDQPHKSLDVESRENLLQGIANGNFDSIFQSMLANDMVSKGTITTEQMRQICAAQIEHLKQAGRESLKAHRFVTTVAEIRVILSPLLEEQTAKTTEATQPKPAIQPLSAAQTPTETQLDPEIANQQQLQKFLANRLQFLQTSMQGNPNMTHTDQFQVTSRINLIQRLTPAIANGKQLSSEDGRLLLFLINEVKKDQPNMTALSAAQAANDQTAAPRDQYTAMRAYVSQHTQPETITKAA